MESLLRDWGFEEYIEIFKENEVDIDTFATIDEDLIKELIPKVGPRAKFLQKFRFYNSNIPLIFTAHQNDVEDEASSFAASTSSTITNVSVASCSNVNSIELGGQTPPESVASSLSDIVAPRMEAIVGLSEDQIRSTPAALHRRQCLSKTNLENLLNMTNQGKAVLNYYNTNKEFDRSTRDKLVDLIIEYETRENIDKRITIQQFQDYANAIQELFYPTEQANIYFFHSNYKNQKVGSGKLFRRYYNYRRSLKKCGMLQSTDAKKHDEEGGGSNASFEESDELLWLKNSSEPWHTVEKYWKYTFKIRYEKLKSEVASGLSLSEYINDFPALKSNLGYTLLESDYEQVYPDTSMKMYSNSWKTFSERVIKYASKLKDKQIQAQLLEINTADNNDDEKFLRTIILLPYLLTTHTLKRKKGVGSWRPSKIEIAEGFILHINAIDDLQTKIEAKREKLKRFGITLQPTPIVVGPSLSEIDQSYVYVDGHLFSFEKGIKAVDSCFKIIHSLHALYPLEAEAVWLLVQKAVYGITSPWDKNLTSVSVLLTELGY